MSILIHKTKEMYDLFKSLRNVVEYSDLAEGPDSTLADFTYLDLYRYELENFAKQEHIGINNYFISKTSYGEEPFLRAETPSNLNNSSDTTIDKFRNTLGTYWTYNEELGAHIARYNFRILTVQTAVEEQLNNLVDERDDYQEASAQVETEMVGDATSAASGQTQAGSPDLGGWF
jgi:hypothetical protein